MKKILKIILCVLAAIVLVGIATLLMIVVTVVGWIVTTGLAIFLIAGSIYLIWTDYQKYEKEGGS